VPEIIAALVILSGGTDILPRGRIDSLKVIEEGGVITGRVSIVSKAGRRSTAQTVSAEILGAALIRLCNAEGIPLARKAQKRLMCAGDGLAFHLDLDAAQTPLSSAVSLAAIEANARAAFRGA
jgi:hypothetical protein